VFVIAEIIYYEKHCEKTVRNFTRITNGFPYELLAGWIDRQIVG
jgi:hypothetical protein